MLTRRSDAGVRPKVVLPQHARASRPIPRASMERPCPEERLRQLDAALEVSRAALRSARKRAARNIVPMKGAVPKHPRWPATFGTAECIFS